MNSIHFPSYRYSVLKAHSNVQKTMIKNKHTKRRIIFSDFFEYLQNEKGGTKRRQRMNKDHNGLRDEQKPGVRSFHPKIISPHITSPHIISPHIHFTPRSFHPTFISPHIHFTPQSFHPTFISPHFHFTPYCNYTKASRLN